MELLLTDKNLKRLEIAFFMTLAIFILCVGLFFIDNTEYLKKGLYYIWILVFGYSFFGTMFNVVNIKNRKIFIFLLCISFIVSFFILPSYFDTIKYINVMIVFYNIIFFLFLYFISEVNNKIFALITINSIVLTGCFINIDKLSFSTIITYIISLFLVLYSIYVFNKELITRENMHNLFFILGCLFEIVFYFVIISLSLFDVYEISFNWFLFFNLIQPVMYWVGINLIMLEKNK